MVTSYSDSSRSQNDTESEGENSDLKPSQPKKCCITATYVHLRRYVPSTIPVKISHFSERVVFGLQSHFPKGENESP